MNSQATRRRYIPREYHPVGDLVFVERRDERGVLMLPPGNLDIVGVWEPVSAIESVKFRAHERREAANDA